MNERRRQRLEGFRRIKNNQKRFTHRHILDDEYFVSLKTEINKLEGSIGGGLSIKKLDPLLLQERLQTISELIDIHGPLKNIQDLISQIKVEVPDSFEINNLSQLIEALRLNRFEFPGWFKRSLYQDITKELSKINDIIESQTLDISQDPGDFLPMRRVIKVGSKFKFSDS